MPYLYSSIKDYIKNIHSIRYATFGTHIKYFALCLCGYSVNDFINYKLSKKRFSTIVREYIPYYRRNKMRGNTNNSINLKVLQNKFLTNKYLSSNHIATTKLFYLIDQGKIYKIEQDFSLKIQNYDELLPGRYVIKPVNQRWGIGIEFLQVCEKYYDDGDVLATIKQLIQKSYDNPHIIEEQIENIQVLDNLNNNSLNTLRIVTVKRNDSIDIIFACIRFSSGNSKIDNWSSGGYAANVNLYTNISEIAFKKFYDERETKNEITNGLKIPYFEDSKDLVIEAHNLFEDIKSIGWDVAITKTGPIIIEGNEDWDVILPQKLLNRGIKECLYV